MRVCVKHAACISPLPPLQAPSCQDTSHQVGCVFECLFTSSPGRFILNLYCWALTGAQEQLIKIDPHRPCQLYPTLLQGNWEERRCKEGILTLWKRALEQVYQGSFELGWQGWSSVVLFSTAQTYFFQNNISQMCSRPETGSPLINNTKHFRISCLLDTV